MFGDDRSFFALEGSWEVGSWEARTWKTRVKLTAELVLIYVKKKHRHQLQPQMGVFFIVTGSLHNNNSVSNCLTKSNNSTRFPYGEHLAPRVCDDVRHARNRSLLRMPCEIV